MEYVVEARNPRTKQYVEALMPSMIDQLKLTNSRKLVVVKVSKECNEMGMTIPIDLIDSYIVLVRPGNYKDIGLTLAHEMVHVRQLAKGILKTVNGTNYWRGKKFSKKTKYLEMPWELDAYARQEIIFRKAIEE